VVEEVAQALEASEWKQAHGDAEKTREVEGARDERDDDDNEAPKRRSEDVLEELHGDPDFSDDDLDDAVYEDDDDDDEPEDVSLEDGSFISAAAVIEAASAEKRLVDLEEDARFEAALANLTSANRRERQEAAHALAEVAQQDPARLEPYAQDVYKALKYPEPQTRWGVLTALAELTNFNSAHATLIRRGKGSIEESLFDEQSHNVHASAFKALVAYGKLKPANSKFSWPYLDDALQVYHGDPEYREMLGSLLEFAQGKLDKSVKEEMAARLAFDADAAYEGYIPAASREIIAALKL
jgi:hypothetical protein